MVLPHPQVLHDVGLHLGRRRGGERDDRNIVADEIEHLADAAVLGAEIVTPLRNAVGFVDGDEGDLGFPEKLDVLFLGERFGRYEEQFGLAGRDVVLHLPHLRFGERGVQEVGHLVGVAVGPDGVHLVFHERDQGRDDEGTTVHHHARQLVAEALAAAGWHDYESVFSIKKGLDDSFLISLKPVEPKIFG